MEGDYTHCPTGGVNECNGDLTTVTRGSTSRHRGKLALGQNALPFHSCGERPPRSSSLGVIEDCACGSAEGVVVYLYRKRNLASADELMCHPISGNLYELSL